MGKHDVRKFSDRVERAAVRALKKVRFRLAGHGSLPQRVFIAGMQRSGTNMVMEVLDRSLYTDVYHETDPRAFQHYEMRPRADIHDLVNRSGAPYFIIKALCELDQLKSLMEDFAPAKLVWIFRDFNDSVNSATASFSRFAARMTFMYDDRLGAGWHGRGMSDETHACLRQCYHSDISEASAAAMMWYYRNILFFEQGFDTDPRVLLVKYELLVTQPQLEFPRIFRFLGIPYSSWVNRHVFASSVRRKAIPAIDQPIVNICQSLTQRLEKVQAEQRRTEEVN